MKKMILSLILTAAVIMEVAAPAGAYLSFGPRNLGNISDLSTPTTDQRYPVGMELAVTDSSKYAMKEYMYVWTNIALTAYRTYAINVSSYAAGEYQVAVASAAAFATSSYATDKRAIVCIPQVAFAAGTWGFVQTGGDCTAYCIGGSTVATCGKIVSGSTNALGITGESASATKPTAYTVGISKKTRGGSGTTTYFLFGKHNRVLISN